MSAPDPLPLLELATDLARRAGAPLSLTMMRIADNLQLGPRGYSILIKGVEVARGVALFSDRIELPLAPFMGIMAVAPPDAKREFGGTHIGYVERTHP